MKKPSNLSVVPPGGWHSRFPDGYEVHAQHSSDYLRQCFQHLEANGGDTGTGWQERMWDQLCATHPEIAYDDSEVKERGIGPDDVRRFLRTIWETWKEGAEPVTEELQNSRIEVCLRCPKKGYTACCGGCSGIAQSLSEFTMGRNIRSLPEIHKVSCQACGCYLETKTMFPVDVLRAVDKKLGDEPAYDPQCWMLTESGLGTQREALAV